MNYDDIHDILKAVKEGDPIARLAFYKEFIRRGDIERGLQGLIPLLKEKDEYVRKEASKSLGDLSDKRAIEPLSQLLEDESNEVRICAACALGRLGDNRVFDVLSSLLQHKDKYIRVRSAASLWRLDPRLAIESLISLLPDYDQSFRFNVAFILNKCTGKSFIFGNTDYKKWKNWWNENKHKFEKP